MKVGRRRHGVFIAAPGSQGRSSTSPCCHRRRPTGGGGPRSEGGSTAGCRRGDRGIAAAVTAALAQWYRLTTRGARSGAALAASDREDVDAACRSMTATWTIERAERARRRRGGGSQGGEEDEVRRGGEDAVVGGVASAVDDNGEDDGGGRQHHATTNPVMKTMSTMAAVADDDGVDGQRRR